MKRKLDEGILSSANSNLRSILMIKDDIQAIASRPFSGRIFTFVHEEPGSVEQELFDAAQEIELICGLTSWLRGCK